MNDEQIIELYFERNEAAIAESREKYSAYCMKIAMSILSNELDSEECLNDTWYGAWRSIPPKRPSNLATYFGKITRNLSINRYKTRFADKRVVNEFTVSLDELETEVSKLLDTVQSDMLKRATEHRDAHTTTAVTYEEFKEAVATKPGFIKAMWCMDVECDKKIKEDTTATSRCMPFEQEHLSDVCVCCGKPAKTMVYWGKAY